VQHIVFANKWWLCALSEAMARQGSTNYLAGKRIFPHGPGKPIPGYLEKKIWRSGIFLVNNQG
jgi:hypothetical protein